MRHVVTISARSDSSASHSTVPPSESHIVLSVELPFGTSKQVPRCMATGGRQIILNTCDDGSFEQLARPSNVEVETRETRVCSGRKVRAESASSSCAGSTQTKMISAPSTTAWLSAATVQQSCAAASRALRAAERGESTTELGAAGPVQRPVQIASAIAPVPTKPTVAISLLADCSGRLAEPDLLRVLLAELHRRRDDRLASEPPVRIRELHLA
jgi:hypothetical protein